MHTESLTSLIEREVDLDRLLIVLGQYVAHRVMAERATIWDDGLSELFSHLSDAPELGILSIGEGIVGRCARLKQPLLIDDVRTDEDWNLRLTRRRASVQKACCVHTWPVGGILCDPSPI